MIPSPDLNLNSECITKPLVYGWRRSGNYLYIGMSKKSIGRLGSNHQTINVVDFVQEDDVIDIWFCSSIEEAKKLEKRLIKEFKPPYNYTHNHLQTAEQKRTKLEMTRPSWENILRKTS